MGITMAFLVKVSGADIFTYIDVNDRMQGTLMKFGFISILLFLASAANAQASEQVDYCHDAKINQDWHKQITEYPEDPIILKLAGLREGLCLMIDRGQIKHEQGITIWEDERQRSIVDRNNEQAKQMPKYNL